MLVSHNIWIIIDFIDDGTGGVEYKHSNKTIIDGSFKNMSLVVSKVKYGSIDAED